jgi:hypothetical protein
MKRRDAWYEIIQLSGVKVRSAAALSAKKMHIDYKGKAGPVCLNKPFCKVGCISSRSLARWIEADIRPEHNFTRGAIGFIHTI